MFLLLRRLSQTWSWPYHQSPRHSLAYYTHHPFFLLDKKYLEVKGKWNLAFGNLNSGLGGFMREGR